MTADFILGFLCCMLCDVVWALTNFVLQQGLKVRAERRRLEREDKQ